MYPCRPYTLGEASGRPRRGGDRGTSGSAGTRLSALGKSLRRASVRVVNFAGTQLEDRPIRLQDEDDDTEAAANAAAQAELAAEGNVLRGRTLGMFGPRNPIRIAMHKLLLWP